MDRNSSSYHNSQHPSSEPRSPTRDKRQADATRAMNSYIASNGQRLQMTESQLEGHIVGRLAGLPSTGYGFYPGSGHPRQQFGQTDMPKQRDPTPSSNPQTGSTRDYTHPRVPFPRSQDEPYVSGTYRPTVNTKSSAEPKYVNAYEVSPLTPAKSDINFDSGYHDTRR